MLSELKDLLAVWIAGVTAAIEAVMTRIMPRRCIMLVEGDANSFTARTASATKAAPPETSFRLSQGRLDPALSAEWQTALRGRRLDVLMRADQVLFRPVDFPKAAAGFLDGMIRAQIDRLTPWPASDVVFGLTRPEPTANERITLTLAATSKQKIQPLLKFATDAGAASVTGRVEVPDGGHAAEPVKVFELPLTGLNGTAIDVPRLLRRTLLGACLAAVASLVIAAYVGGALDAEQQELQRRISQRRTALLHVKEGGGPAEALLAKRKQTSPSSVMVLEAITRALPDTTYVTELRVEGDKIQIVGLTQDAPSLIRLMEQSPQFTRATFFAPTTRSQNEPGERFHIEAHITPYFGLPS